MQVLLSEPDPTNRAALTLGLRLAGVAVLEAAGPSEALAHWRRHRPDVAVIVLAPKATVALAAIAEMRATNGVSILVLTDDPTQQNVAFDAGADAVAPRRVGLRELIERVRALHRRALDQPLPRHGETITVGRLRIEAETREVFVDNVPLRTTPLEFKLIQALALNFNNVVPTERLLAFLWDDGRDDRNSLRCHVSHVRRKLALCSAYRITAVHHVGYRLESNR